MKVNFKLILCVCVILAGFIFIQGKLADLRLISTQIYMSSILSERTNHDQASDDTTGNIKGVFSREDVYEERRNVIKDGCRKVNSTPRTDFNIETRGLVLDKVHSIYYCPITKVSSTFWKRILTVLASQGHLKSPFEIRLGGVKLSNVNKLSEEELNVLRENGTSFMFVRDPYARLFSGYENKIYHANLMFWKAVGRKVVQVVRQNNDTVYKNFGFDVTFPEFIKYILIQSESGKSINFHFTPMHRKCDPCSTYFHYIGKLETFQDDADFLISKWTNEFDDVSLQFSDFHKESALDTAFGHVNFLFQAKKIIEEIKFPFHKIMIRTWRDLQIRGYISKYIEYPYNESDADLITKEEYFEAIKSALEIPVNRTQVKLQRKEALIQAYSEVPIEDMERLRQYVLKDCLLFGYDDRPQALFDRTVNKKDVTDFIYLEGLSRD